MLSSFTGSFKLGRRRVIPATGIVTSNLVLRLDPDNASSYSGSGTTWTDLAAPAQNLTLYGSPTYTSGTPSYFTFNGTTQYANTVTTGIVNTTAYTKSAWFYLNGYQDNNIFSGDGHFIYMGPSASVDKKIYCGHADWGSFTAYPSTATIDLNKWYNVTLTFSTANGMTLYINGVQDSTYTAQKTAHPGTGTASVAAYGSGNLLNGRVGKVYCYNVELTAAQVLQNYNNDKATYEFSNPTQTTGSAVTISAISPFAGGGNSYIFSSNVNSYLSFPASADWAMGTGDFTVEWFSRQTTLSQFQRVFTVGDYPAIDFGVSIESGTFYFWSGGDADTDYNSASATTINTWYHWAVVRSGTTLSVYRDGTLRGSTVTNNDNINDTSTAFIVGNTNTFATNAAFVGAITNFRLVKGLAVYTGNFTVPTSALTAEASANPYGGSNTAAIGTGFTKLLLVP